MLRRRKTRNEHLSLPFSQNAELFTLTYGAIVTQMLEDFEDIHEVNQQLDRMYTLLVLTFSTHTLSQTGAHPILSETPSLFFPSPHRRGYRIGVRLIDEFLARSAVGRCQDLRETADVISKVAFKMFLGVSARVDNWAAEDKEFSLILVRDCVWSY